LSSVHGGGGQPWGSDVASAWGRGPWVSGDDRRRAWAVRGDDHEARQTRRSRWILSAVKDDALVSVPNCVDPTHPANSRRVVIRYNVTWPPCTTVCIYAGSIYTPRCEWRDQREAPAGLQILQRCKFTYTGLTEIQTAQPPHKKKKHLVLLRGH